MPECVKCNVDFKTPQRLLNHNKKNPNCINKCSICLKKYSSKQSLIKHESIVCEQKYECEKCNNVYSTKYYLKDHKCVNEIDNNIILKQGDNCNNIGDILKNLPNISNISNNRQIVINQNNQNIYNNNNNSNNSNEIQVDHKNIQVDNKNINVDNKNIQVDKMNLNINQKTKNFFDTKPRLWSGNYKEHEDYRYLIKLDDYDEKTADLYVYDEENFKAKQPKNLVYKYDKEALQVEGMKVLFSKLQKDPNNRNVMIRKMKSGTCYVYEKEWVEKKLKTIIVKICNKLCDCIYDKETSLNHFMRLVIGSQPKRCIELRKHIEKEIINNKCIKQICN